MYFLNALIARVSQEYYLRGEAYFAFFEQRKIVVSSFGKSGTEDFTVFLVNYDLGFEVVLLLFG
jgi:hypothetical protein